MITVNDLRSRGPCNDPTNWVPENWQGTLLDIYNLENLSGSDKVLMAIWFLSEEESIAFGEWCAAQVEDPVRSARVLKYAHAYPIQAGVWMAAKNAESSGLSRESQVSYLIDLENSRGV